MRRAAAAMFAMGALMRPIAALADDAARPDLSAQSTLGADQIQFAAHEHDLGYRAYLAKLYGEAATHFENAFFAAPNPAELRYAIRARRDAVEPARAATLAAIGQRKFGADASMSKLADEVIVEARPSVYEVRIVSETECSVAVDEKIVAVEKVKAFRFFVIPGRHDLRVSWSDDRTKTLAIDAKPGASQTLELEAPAPAGQTPPQPSLPIAPPIPVVAVPPVSLTSTPQPAEAYSPKPLGPVVFIVGAALTVAGAGLTAWSGIDAQNNPGPNVVRSACFGVGPTCPDYQKGLSAQRRTNILLAGASGLAVITAVIGVFFTRWRASERPESSAAGRRQVYVEPVFGLGEAALRGTF